MVFGEKNDTAGVSVAQLETKPSAFTIYNYKYANFADLTVADIEDRADVGEDLFTSEEVGTMKSYNYFFRGDD